MGHSVFMATSTESTAHPIEATGDPESEASHSLIPAPIGHRPAVGSDEERASMQLDEAIWNLRREGHTFNAIGLSLKMSRQSVSERYGAS